MPECVSNDHDALRKALIHPYLARFEDEDCFFLKDVSANAVRNSLQALAGKTEEKSLFFFYLSCYCASVQNGRHKGTYFLFNDCNFRGAHNIERTSISLTEMSELLKRVPCKERVMCLDVCHNRRPKDTFLAVLGRLSRPTSLR